MRRFGQMAAIAMTAFLPAMALAQGPWQVPPGQRPSAGLCRIWIDGVPPGRQPQPTSCAYARTHVPRNGRIIYGSGTNGRDGRIFTTNDRVVNVNGRRCVQRQDRFGRLQTVCADGDHDWDDRVVARSERAERDRIRQRELDARRWEIEKARRDNDRRFEERRVDVRRAEDRRIEDRRGHDRDHDHDHDRDHGHDWRSRGHH